MRTIDPILADALANQKGEPFFQITLHEFQTPGIGAFVTREVIEYKLEPLQLNITFIYDTDTLGYPDVLYATFRRGATVNGTEYYIETSAFSIKNFSFNGYLMTVEATLLPPDKVTLTGDVSYWQLVQNYCTALNLTASRTDAAESFWNNQFLPTGKQVNLNSAQQFSQLLKQKFFAAITDAGNNTALFFSAAKYNSTYDYTITTDQLISIEIPNGHQFYVGLLWRNESASIFKPVAPYDIYPLYNLGFIKSGDQIPTSHTSDKIKERITKIKPLKLPVNLTYLTGDKVLIKSTNKTTNLFQMGILLVTESYSSKQTPSWQIEIQLWDYVANTEGGSLPSTIERVAAYTPLVSTGFDGNLDSTVNNLQALAEAVDDMDLGAAPATTAANDFQVGNGAGVWIKQTLAQVKTILSIFADAASDSIYYVRRNATWTNLKTYTDTLYAAISHTHAAGDVTSGTMATARLGSGTADNTTVLHGDQTYKAINNSKVQANRADASSAQTLTAGAWNKIQYDTEVTDVGGEYDPSTNYRFTANTAGFYIVTASILTAGYAWAVGEILQLAIYKNGSHFMNLMRDTIEANNTSYKLLASTLMLSVAAGDYIEIYFYNGHSTSVDLFQSAIGNHLEIYKLP